MCIMNRFMSLLTSLCLICLLGFLFDITGNYDIPFFVSGSIQIVGGLCGLAAFVIKHRRRRAKHS